MAEGGCDSIFPPSKRTKSEVWAILVIIAQGQLDEDGSPICRSCKKKVVASDYNTSNLLTHLCDHHPQLFSKSKVS